VVVITNQIFYDRTLLFLDSAALIAWIMETLGCFQFHNGLSKPMQFSLKYFGLCFAHANSVKILITRALPNNESGQHFCATKRFFNDLAITGTTIKWYDAFTQTFLWKYCSAN
jgi:hypothetical protein